MTSKDGASLAEQRLALRDQIRAQRELIAEKLDPTSSDQQSYPRSSIMRFLTKRPELSVTLVAEVASFMLGARHRKAIAAVMGVARIVRSASSSGSRSRSAERANGEHSAIT